MTWSPAPLPPFTGRTYVQLVRPRVNNPVSGIVYSSRVTGVDTHWVNGVTHPCLGLPPVCPFHALSPVRWKGFLFGRSDQSGKSCLFELPKLCVQDSLQLRDPKCNLRGAHMEVIRIGPHVNSECTVRLRLEANVRICPSEEPDVIRWLAQIWGIEDPRDTILRMEGGRGE